MSRRKGFRRIRFYPEANYFRPRGVPASYLKEVVLGEDEWEALRLADFEGLEQTESAKQMKISQSTFQRILKKGRKKTACALVLSRAIILKGGEEEMVRPRRGLGGRGLGRGLGQSRGLGQGRGRMGGPLAAGPGGKCVCTNPECKMEVAHQVGVPCFQVKCEKCGSPMIRKR